jgi:hypothetical protein
MSEIQYGKIVGDAFRRDVLSIRALPMICLTVVEGCILILLSLHLASRLLPLLSSGGSLAQLFSLELMLSAILWFLALAILLFLFEIVGLWLSAVIMQQAFKDARGEQVPGFAEAFISVKGRILSLIIVFILLAVISGVFGSMAGTIPYLGSMLSIVISLLMSLVFFMAYPYVVLARKGAVDSISASFDHFRSRMGQLSLMWLLSTVIGTIILFVFAIPMIVAIISLAIGFFQAIGAGHGISSILLPALTYTLSSPGFLASVMILMIGSAVSAVFSCGVLARYYYEAARKSEMIFSAL